MTELWTVGLNMPGYMPETEPSEYDSWDEARDSLIEEMERTAEIHAEQIGISAEHDAEQTAMIGKLDAAIASVKALTPGTPYGETVGKWHYWLDKVTE